ncbi:3-oxoacyl-ACP synthase [Variovorax sp. Root434]|uniref:3-oxoacyl-ACP synthase n=1 Tax=Variovorax sp. Root434 TaxID=1736536 RepID=UPI0006F5C1CC|nr:3-oxoacyl-ACP synthase [Variovorax sp. Root434]KQX27864.1 3-oxoacyl-ACP synthase [Variovorax sp. Root434]
MSEVPVVISRTGMVTGVGLDAPASCAAIRGAIDNFRQTSFRDRHGEWIMGCEVPLERPWRGEKKLLLMAVRAIAECIEGFDRATCEETPLLLCLAEADRPGRGVTDDTAFFEALQHELGFDFHPESAVIAKGHVSVAVALLRARQLIGASVAKQVVVAASDSLLDGAALADCEARDRLLTSENSDGFIPGEGAAALLVEPLRAQPWGQLVCRGIGFAVEKSHIDSEEPLRADGLTAAIKQSLQEAGCNESVLDFKIIDASGGQYVFKEATLAFGRIDRTRRTEFDVWHPADCIGEVGAPVGLAMVAVLKTACEKAYAKGSNVLLHLGNDDGKRAAMIFSWHFTGV